MKLLLDENLPLAVVVLRAASNDLDDIRPLIAPLLAALNSLTRNAVTEIN